MNKIIDILSKTNDGDDLDPKDLKLIELGVNGELNEKGEKELEKLYCKVQEGYQKPWLCGIENITRDQEGYIYWKGKLIEHFEFSQMSKEEVEQQTKELERRCKYLEENGYEVNSNSVIWEWEEISGEHKEPDFLRSIAKKITEQLNINGAIDISYICNIIARETGIGDGCNNYFITELDNDYITKENLKSAAKEIKSSFRLTNLDYLDIINILEKLLP